ncbi:unnamed protein product, partial [Mesorhabditis spiculigera]
MLATLPIFLALLLIFEVAFSDAYSSHRNRQFSLGKSSPSRLRRDGPDHDPPFRKCGRMLGEELNNVCNNRIKGRYFAPGEKTLADMCCYQKTCTKAYLKTFCDHSPDASETPNNLYSDEELPV